MKRVVSLHLLLSFEKRSSVRNPFAKHTGASDIFAFSRCSGTGQRLPQSNSNDDAG